MSRQPETGRDPTLDSVLQAAAVGWSHASRHTLSRLPSQSAQVRPTSRRGSTNSPDELLASTQVAAQGAF